MFTANILVVLLDNISLSPFKKKKVADKHFNKNTW